MASQDPTTSDHPTALLTAPPTTTRWARLVIAPNRAAYKWWVAITVTLSRRSPMGDHRLHDCWGDPHSYGWLAGQPFRESHRVSRQSGRLRRQLRAVWPGLEWAIARLLPCPPGAGWWPHYPDGHGVSDQCISTTPARPGHGTLRYGHVLWPGSGTSARRLCD